MLNTTIILIIRRYDSYSVVNGLRDADDSLEGNTQLDYWLSDFILLLANQ